MAQKANKQETFYSLRAVQRAAREDAAKTEVQWRGANRPALLKMIEQMDEQVGAILRQIDEMGARENTIVLFMSDNGAPAGGSNAPLRGAKSSVYEGGIRMPLLVRWPGVLEPGSLTDQVTLMMDVTATLAGSAGVAGRRLTGSIYGPNGGENGRSGGVRCFGVISRRRTGGRRFATEIGSWFPIPARSRCST